MRSAIRLYLVLTFGALFLAVTVFHSFDRGEAYGRAEEQAAAHTRARAQAVAATNLEGFNNLMDLRSRRVFLNTVPGGCRPWFRGLKGMDPL